MSLFGSRKIGFFGGGGGGSAGTVSGTGVANYLALWSGATTITQSRILDNPSIGIFAFKNLGVSDGLIFDFDKNDYTLGIDGSASGISATVNNTTIGDFNGDSTGLSIVINNTLRRIRSGYKSVTAKENGFNLDFTNNIYQLGNWNTLITGNNKSVLSFYQDYFEFTTKNSTRFMFVENGQWGIGDTNGSGSGYALQSDGSGLLYTQANSSSVGFYMSTDQFIRFGSDNNGTYIDVNDNTTIIKTLVNGNENGFKIDFNNLYTLLGYEGENTYIKLDSMDLKTTFQTNSLTLDDSGSGALILNDSGVVQQSPFLRINVDGQQYYISLWQTA